MRLRRKIESPEQPPLLVTVFGVGYRLDDRPR
jgi:DNA-binding response OmpR family regulator